MNGLFLNIKLIKVMNYIDTGNLIAILANPIFFVLKSITKWKTM